MPPSGRRSRLADRLVFRPAMSTKHVGLTGRSGMTLCTGPCSGNSRRYPWRLPLSSACCPESANCRTDRSPSTMPCGEPGFRHVPCLPSHCSCVAGALTVCGSRWRSNGQAVSSIRDFQLPLDMGRLQIGAWRFSIAFFRSRVVNEGRRQANKLSLQAGADSV